MSYKIDVVETEYDSFIEFLNRNTASQYDLEKDTPKQLPFDIETNYYKSQQTLKIAGFCK